ncbi:MAG: hypothetical protein B7Y45_04465 [Sphingomonas sp. 28-66-16]|nr:MAG: hypothetical protein B7Y45_04465 [Sphingomonas sp. 28-66-16]
MTAPLARRLAAAATLLLLQGSAWAQSAEEAPPPAAAAAPAATLNPFDKAEVLDVDNDVWDPCTILAVYKGAYQVSCKYTKSLRRDVHVRKPGAAPAGQTAAQAVTGPPFKRDDIVLASPLSLPDRWELCIVERNALSSSNGYALQCGGSPYFVGRDWIRADPEATQ